jgi:hypothetical protein
MTTTSSTKSDQIQELLNLLNPRPSTSSAKWWTLIDKIDLWLWSITVVAFAGAAAVAAYRSWFHACSHWSFRLVYWLLIFGQLGSQITVLRQIYGQFKGFLRPVETLFSTINPNIIRDCVALTKLRDYDSGTLDFVAKRLKLEASQFRKRINYIAPGIEKIGFVPSVLAGLLYLLKLADRKDLPSWLHLPPGSVVGIAAAISVVYLGGLILTVACQRIDQLAQLVSLAAGKEEEKNGKITAEAKSDLDEKSESEDGEEEEQNSDDGSGRSDDDAS